MRFLRLGSMRRKLNINGKIPLHEFCPIWTNFLLYKLATFNGSFTGADYTVILKTKVWAQTLHITWAF